MPGWGIGSKKKKFCRPGSSQGISKTSFELRLLKKRKSVQISSTLCYFKYIIKRVNISGPLCAKHHGNYYMYSLIYSPQQPREVDDCFSTFWLQAIGTQLLLTVNKKGLLGPNWRKGKGGFVSKKLGKGNQERPKSSIFLSLLFLLEC